MRLMWWLSWFTRVGIKVCFSLDTYLLRSATLTSCRQSIPHALSAWHHQEVMTNHLDLQARTTPLHLDTTNTTQHSLTYSFLHHTTPHTTLHITSHIHTTTICTITRPRHRRLFSLCLHTIKYSNCTYRRHGGDNTLPLDLGVRLGGLHDAHWNLAGVFLGQHIRI
jgi:hypothetical protein